MQLIGHNKILIFGCSELNIVATCGKLYNSQGEKATHALPPSLPPSLPPNIKKPNWAFHTAALIYLELTHPPTHPATHLAFSVPAVVSSGVVPAAQGPRRGQQARVHVYIIIVAAQRCPTGRSSKNHHQISKYSN